jgi:ABC-type bacteriocin/lantibiotic exporter with double-glycine peptidase domain
MGMKILNFPEFRQTSDYDCGANALQAILAYYGIDVEENKIIKTAGTNKRIGTTIKGITKTLKKYKLKFHSGELDIEKIKKQLDRNHPVILILQAWKNKKKVGWEKDWRDGHYVIAIGYDKNKIYFEDPASIFRTYLSYNELDKRWHNKQKNQKYIHYALSVYGKKPKFSLKKEVHMD